MDLQLVDIQKIPIKNKWPHEEYHFTPWLLENISKLGDALGMDLESGNAQREVKVGPYYADIVVTDNNIPNEQNKVVIENQYEKTNHDHLGKAITYASVLGASSVVWIAEKFGEEHLRAIEWLNELSPEYIRFYAVEVELWKLSETTANVRFVVVGQPNDMVKTTIDEYNAKELTERQTTALRFWTAFRKSLLETRLVATAQKAYPQNWFDVAIGKTHVHIANTISNKNDGCIKCEIYIGHQIADTMLPFLKKRKEEIEGKLGFKLEWEQNPNTRDKVIFVSNTGFNFDDESDFNTAIDWLVEKTVVMRKVFMPIVKEYRD